MLAVAGYYKGKNEPPPELLLAFRCKAWRVLPRSGGLREQRFDEVNRMTVALTTYEALEMYSKVKPSQLAEFMRKSPRTWKIIEILQEYERG